MKLISALACSALLVGGAAFAADSPTTPAAGSPSASTAPTTGKTKTHKHKGHKSAPKTSDSSSTGSK
ncbi:MAG: hypothetical protein ACHQAR_04065 [Steroidobacterales bacterium]